MLKRKIPNDHSPLSSESESHPRVHTESEFTIIFFLASIYIYSCMYEKKKKNYQQVELSQVYVTRVYNETQKHHRPSFHQQLPLYTYFGINIPSSYENECFSRNYNLRPNFNSRVFYTLSVCIYKTFFSFIAAIVENIQQEAIYFKKNAVAYKYMYSI